SSASNLRKHLQRKHPTVLLCHLDVSSHAVRPKANEPPAAANPNDDDPDPISAVPIPMSASTSSFALPSTSSSASASTSSVTGTARIPPPSQRTQQPIKTSHQASVESFLKRKLPLASKKIIDNNLMKLFTKDFQPFRIVEDEGFRAFVQVLNPSYTLPSRKTIGQTFLPAAYEEAMHKLKEVYSGNEIGSVTLTTDCWTSSNGDSFMAVTSHYLNFDMELNSNVLECFLFTESHTSENLAIELKKVADEWNIKDKIVLCVSDNAANITKAIKEILQWRHFGCLAHTINLAVKNSLEVHENVKDLIKKIKSIVTHFKRSTKSSNKLTEIQKQNGLQPKKLINDVETRWNSTFDMLVRFTELEMSIRTTIALLDKDVDALLPEEWLLAQKIKLVLQPMKELTDFISGEKYPSASSVIIVIQGIQEDLKELKTKKENHAVFGLMESLESELMMRVGSLEESSIFTNSTFLDPRYKNIFFSKEETADLTKKKITDLLEEEITLEARAQTSHSTGSRPETTISCTSSSASIPSVLWRRFDRISESYKTVGTSRSRAIAEVGRYLEEPLLDRNKNPLKWWQEHGYNFPYLKKLVRKHFCPIVTSVPCERIFSRAGLILNERRTRLSSDKVKKLVFLNYNY
ncbi:Zinc finger BED domain-containing protein 1, partial [Araneus ventricosus]